MFTKVGLLDERKKPVIIVFMYYEWGNCLRSVIIKIMDTSDMSYLFVFLSLNDN
jgi:hypothetical protein